MFIQKIQRAVLAGSIACSFAVTATTTAAAAHASPAPAEVDTITVDGTDSSLTVTLDDAVSPETAGEVRETLEDSLQADPADPAATTATPPGSVETLTPMGGDPGPKYRVIKCSTSNTVITDRNGRFDVRYNCRHNNVNWGYRVSSKLVSIAVGNMQEKGLSWYKGSRKIGQNAPHNVPVGYFLHGTQGGITSGDLLSWHDTMTFRVNAGGRPGTAVLNVGGTFVVVR
ncbi:hypothetical protein [Streptomyces sp. SYSU K21746]